MPGTPRRLPALPPVLVLSHPKFDGLVVERSTILEAPTAGAHHRRRRRLGRGRRLDRAGDNMGDVNGGSVGYNSAGDNMAPTLHLADLGGLGALPAVLAFPEPPKPPAAAPGERPRGTELMSTFRGTPDDFAEIDRIKTMQELHVLDMVRREHDLEMQRQRMLRPSIGMPPDPLRCKKLEKDFARERLHARSKLEHVIEDHQAYIAALTRRAREAKAAAVAKKMHIARTWLWEKTVWARSGVGAAATACAIVALQRVLGLVAAQVRENHLERVVRPKHAEARAFLAAVAWRDHERLRLELGDLLCAEPVVVDGLTFEQLEEGQLQLRLSVSVVRAAANRSGHLLVTAVDPDPTLDGTGQCWSLRLPLPRLVEDFLSPENAGKSDPALAECNFARIQRASRELIDHLLFRRDTQDRRKLRLHYGPPAAAGERRLDKPVKQRLTSEERAKVEMMKRIEAAQQRTKAGTKRRRNKPRALHSSLFLFRQFELQAKGRFYLAGPPYTPQDAFRCDYLYTKDVNDMLLGVVDALFSVFCRYAMRTRQRWELVCLEAAAQEGEGDDAAPPDCPFASGIGPQLSSAEFYEMLVDAGLVQGEEEEEEEGEEEGEEGGETKDSLRLAPNRAFAQALAVSPQDRSHASFLDFVEALARWTFDWCKPCEAHSFVNILHLTVESVLTALDVENWADLHLRRWDDHVMFLTEGVPRDWEPVLTPPERKLEEDDDDDGAGCLVLLGESDEVVIDTVVTKIQARVRGNAARASGMDARFEEIADGILDEMMATRSNSLVRAES